LLWGQLPRNAYYDPQVIIEAGEGVPPFPYKTAGEDYALNLFLSAHYSVRAEAFCRMGMKGKAEANTVTVDGANSAIKEIILVLKGECSKE
jgi:hypothetical protein